MSKGKTNAMRLLDAAGISYKMHEYEVKDGQIDGLSVSNKIGIEPKHVFKTLVTQGSKGFYVYVIPVESELDLKKAARAANEKKVEMIPVKEIQKQTGYVRGGCSPIGMKKTYPTFIDTRAETLSFIVISAGKIGAQIELEPKHLKQIVNAIFCEIVNKM